MQQSLFGQILLNFNLVSREQLEKALAIQRRSPDRLLGEVLIREGLLDEKTVTSILGVQVRKLELEVNRSQLNPCPSNDPLENATLSDLLRTTVEIGASDLHVTAGEKPMVRLHGQMRSISEFKTPPERARELVLEGLTPKQLEQLNSQNYLDIGFQIPKVGRFRGNIYPHIGGLAAAYRTIREHAWPFRKLGLPASVRQITRYHNGLVLVTGSTGSGKSTTLASLIDFINQTDSRHIITIEDPIEFTYRNDKSVISQREIPTHCPSFPQALDAALREDPDVIVVGEMRDIETIATALTAAETGHLVFGTLHSRTATGAVLRILDQFPHRSRSHVKTMLSANLRAVISQELIPRIDEEGQCLAYEVMMSNSAISHLIREERTNQIESVMQMSRKEGMNLMDDSLSELYEQGKISLEDAYSRAQNKERFTQPA